MANTKKRCKQCKSYFPADSMIKVPAGTFCGDFCMFEWLQQKRVKDDKKAHTAKKKAFKLSDRGVQTKLAQDAFNAYIRYRDRNEPCISCGTQSPHVVYCAGHYRTRGGAPHLRFNQFNVNRQCNNHCNLNLSGNVGEYRINLVRKFGVEKVEWLESQNTPAKLSLEDIISIKVYYTKLLRRVK